MSKVGIDAAFYDVITGLRAEVVGERAERYHVEPTPATRLAAWNAAEKAAKARSAELVGPASG